MKKILFFLILFISSITLVNATSDNIVYEWGDYIHSEITHTFSFIIDTEEYNGNTLILGRIYKRSVGNFITITEYDNTGKKIYEDSIDESCGNNSFIMDGKIFCTYDYYKKIYIYDKTLKFITEVETEDSIKFNDYKEVTDEYYIAGHNIINKETFEVKNSYEFVENHKDFEKYTNAATQEEANQILKNIAEELFPNSEYPDKILFDLNIPVKEDDNIVQMYTAYGPKKYAITYYNSTTKYCEVEIYNDKFEVELNKKIECDVDVPKIMLYENSFVIIKEMMSDYVSQDENDFEEVTMSLDYTEYDYKGNVIYKTKLRDIYASHKTSLQTDNVNMIVKRLIKTKEGFTIFIEFEPYPEGNITETETIEGTIASILRYSYIYDITTKTDNNGTITATKTEAGSGEEIKYEITPKEGYVLGVVKITDSNGNTITTTNRTFTMPSSDVTIEVTFVAENPDTASKTLFIFSSFLIIITSIVLMIKQIKDFNWIKN